jgi:uncharacterized phage protein (TIGR01671 family)
MRSIKFRGLSLKDSTWVYGCLVYSEANAPFAKHVDYAKIITTNGETTEVWVATVGQFTGLQDVDGKDIYEGDIVAPTKFKDKPNDVEYISNGFYRTKQHKGQKYLNPLGNCEVKVVGDAYTDTY